MSEETKRLVLARRARFIALAVAGLSTGCPGPEAPRPCLTTPSPEVDAGDQVPGPPGPEVPK